MMRWIVFSVKGLILSLDRKVLLLKRSPRDRYCPAHWELPGGKMETPNFKKDFMRELREEAGLSVTAKIVFQGMLLKQSAIHKTIFGWPVWHVTFFISVDSGAKKVTLSDEHTHFGWFEAENARRLLLTPESRYALQKHAD